MWRHLWHYMKNKLLDFTTSVLSVKQVYNGPFLTGQLVAQWTNEKMHTCSVTKKCPYMQ